MPVVKNILNSYLRLASERLINQLLLFVVMTTGHAGTQTSGLWSSHVST